MFGCSEIELCLCLKEYVVQISAFSDLIHNVVQKFKDGHSRSTIHPMSCGEGAKFTHQVKFLFNYIKAFILKI